VSRPAISIVIPNWNRRDELRRTLERVTSLNELAKQIIVVDNDSEDGSGEMVRRDFPQVELIELDENRNAAARNVGLERAEAPITFMLDNDSFPLPGTLRRIGEAFDRDRHLGVAACQIELASGEHEPGGLPGVFIGCGAAMRTQLIRDLGGYPSDYGYYVEEYDLACRVWREGYRVRYLAEAKVLHAKSASRRDMDRIMYFLVRNNLKLWHRYSPPGLRRRFYAETVRRYGVVARLEHGVRGFLRGLLAGLYEIATETGPRRVLSLDQIEALFGLPQVRAKLADLAREKTHPPIVYGWGKGLEQIVGVSRETGLVLRGLVPHRPLPVRRTVGLKVLSPEAPAAGSPILIGSLSPGGSLDLEAQARRTWPDARIIRLVDLE